MNPFAFMIPATVSFCKPLHLYTQLFLNEHVQIVALNSQILLYTIEEGTFSSCKFYGV